VDKILAYPNRSLWEGLERKFSDDTLYTLELETQEGIRLKAFTKYFPPPLRAKNRSGVALFVTVFTVPLDNTNS
jgi:hypothetical protein